MATFLYEMRGITIKDIREILKDLTSLNMKEFLPQGNPEKIHIFAANFESIQ